MREFEFSKVSFGVFVAAAALVHCLFVLPVFHGAHKSHRFVGKVTTVMVMVMVSLSFR